jgi:hypothetical protein
MATLATKTRAILDGISEEQWTEYYNELVVYSGMKCRRLYWRNGRTENLPETHSPDSIVREAVTLLYAGERVWNHQRYPESNPVPFLKSVIDSLVSGLVTSHEHKRSVYLADQQKRSTIDGDKFDVEIRGSEDVPDLARPEPLNPEKAAYFSEVEKRIGKAIEDRPDLIRFFGFIQDGRSSSEIAELMQVGVEAVYQMRKLFDARTASIKAELLRR